MNNYNLKLKLKYYNLSSNNKKNFFKSLITNINNTVSNKINITPVTRNIGDFKLEANIIYELTLEQRVRETRKNYH
jgi:hypothetical protein